MDNNQVGRSVAALKKQVEMLEKQGDEFKKMNLRIWERIDEFEARLVGRPPWIVCAVITILFGLCTTLLTMLSILH